MKSPIETVREGTKRLSSSDLASKGRILIRQMTGNAHFANPVPSLAEMQRVVEALEAINVDQQHNPSRLGRIERDLRSAELCMLIKGLAGYVQGISGGELAVILSSGFEVKRKRHASQPMVAPENMRTIRTQETGVISIRWNAVKNRLLYKVQVNKGDPNDQDAWELLCETSRNYLRLEDLEERRVYHFRALAFGALGAGPWSDFASATVY